MSEKVKVKHSFASYKTEDGMMCELDELADKLSRGVAVFPLRLNDLRAQEIVHLARGYKALSEKLTKAAS